MNIAVSFRRLLVTALVAGVVAIIIGGVSLARAGGATSSDTTMVLHETDTAFHFVNISHTQHGAPGDEFIFHGTLAQGTTQVGTLDVVCTLVINRQIQCQGTVTLPGGQLYVSTRTNGTGGKVGTVTTIGIVGGTGRYDTAQGQLTSLTTGKNTSTLTLDIDH